MPNWVLSRRPRYNNSGIQEVQQLALFPDAELGMTGIDDPSSSRCAQVLAKAFCKKSFSTVS